jgi:catechol 2,3-dioxygenase-like lactoylglutathione lyase family enzyme
MHFEHVALNVPDPQAMAKWYVEHLKMRVVRAVDAPPHIHFLADATGRIIFELYANPKAPIPAYGDQSPLVLHAAFAVDDMAATKKRLLAAGATLYSEETTADGSVLTMLRDPWGVALQLVRRGVPLGN